MESIRGDQLGKSVKWSLFAHGALALFIILKSLVFPSDPILLPPSLRVDMVGLPDILKKDLSQVPKKIPENIKTQPNTPVEAKPIEVNPDEMVLKPTKIEKTKEKPRDHKLQSALARIRALEKLKSRDAEEEEEAPVVIKGNQVSAGSSLNGDARESAQSGYLDLLRDSLSESWSLPPWLARQKLVAQVHIRIDPAGRILSAKFVKTSGNQQFDEAILATLRDAQPLPRPPKELLQSLSENGIMVGFPL